MQYKGLPASNDEFGKRKVLAEIRDGACAARAEEKLVFFYSQKAENNPEGRYPNWFYYYCRPLPARHEGCTVFIEYGGNSQGNCVDSNNAGHYDIGKAYRTLRICDLTKFGSNMEISNQWVDRSQSAPKVGRMKTHYIDSFAITVLHEYQHVKFYEGWYMNKVPPPRDRDDSNCTGALCDGIPDDLEHALGFDPIRRKTYKGLLNELDQEVLARDVEGKYVKGLFRKYDWAAPGSNW